MSLLGMLFGGIGLGASTYAGNKPVREKQEYQKKYGETEGYREWMLKGDDASTRAMKKSAFGWELTTSEQAQKIRDKRTMYYTSCSRSDNWFSFECGYCTERELKIHPSRPCREIKISDVGGFHNYLTGSELEKFRSEYIASGADIARMSYKLETRYIEEMKKSIRENEMAAGGDNRVYEAFVRYNNKYKK